MVSNSQSSLKVAIPTLLADCPAVHAFVAFAERVTEQRITTHECVSESKLISNVANGSCQLGMGCGSYAESSLGQHPIQHLDIHLVYASHCVPSPMDSWELGALKDTYISLPEKSYFPRLGGALWRGLNEAVKSSQMVDSYRQITGMLANVKSGACCPFVFPPKVAQGSSVLAKPLAGSSPVSLNVLWQTGTTCPVVNSMVSALDEGSAGQVA